MSLPLFTRVLGELFERLPPSLQALHGVAGSRVFQGESRIPRGMHPLMELLD